MNDDRANQPSPQDKPLPPNNTFAQILQDAEAERNKRRLERQQYSDYWQTRNQFEYAQKPTTPFIPRPDVKPPLEHREWIHRRVREVLLEDHD